MQLFFNADLLGGFFFGKCEIRAGSDSRENQILSKGNVCQIMCRGG